jgi:pyruvate/2-oxoglutarate dehydrogenase complex dihydrolipoamide acyltransferase (E2) component
MKVKFGFLVSAIRRMAGGTYDAEKNFREAKITWLKGEGDEVIAANVILEAETDKVTQEVALGDLCPSASGRIVQLNYESGESWKYGGAQDLPNGDMMFLPALGEIEVDGIKADAPPPAEDIREEPYEKRELPAEEGPTVEIVRAAPAARKLVRESGIDINTIQGTGHGGRVMLLDVKRAIEARVKPKDAISEKPQISEGVILLTPSREWLTVAHNLEKGSNSVIAAGEPDEYDFNELLLLRANHKVEFQKIFGVPLHVSSPVILAVARALCAEEFWTFNGYWHIEDEADRNKDKIVLYRAVNMGISTDLGIKPEINLEEKTIKGTRLRIATMRSVNELGIKEFFRAHHDLISRAARDIRENGGKLKETTLSDWTGWTFIFNNVGAAGHRRGISLFTPKMSAMLNMGVIGKDGKANLQIFFDHRMIDGVPATRFLDAVYEELTKRVLPEIKRACIGV